jgi:unsaturated rhamnogalacturonyl hydrolase
MSPDLRLKIRSILQFSFSISFLLFAFINCTAPGEDDNDVFWTEYNSPEKIGRLVINDLLSRPRLMMYEADFWTGVHYAEAAAGFGAARLAGLLEDPEIINRLSDRYLKVIEDSLVKGAAHVDANVYGILPLELYMHTQNVMFLNQGLELANDQWKNPLPDDLTNQTRYWIDDVWMIGCLQVQAYRATGEALYLDRAAREIDAYLKKLQQPNGLFFHGENAPFFWGRGNGWVAAGLAELISELPESNPYYSSILKGYNMMMHALLEYQSEDGLWRQLIDKQNSWSETSSTAMFGYAISVGVKEGILSKQNFVPVYQKAWNGLVKYIDRNGKLKNVCAGTGKDNTVDYYLSRPRITGDLHGQAPVLWFSYSLLSRSG